MLAARVHEWGADPVLEEVPEPEPAAGEALVAIAAGTVAHIDLTVAGGGFVFRPGLPYIPGTEGAGRIVHSQRWAPGTPVRIRGARMGMARDGTWTERTAVPEDALTELPGDADLSLAATFFSPCATAHAAVHEVGRLQPGERVAVIGASGAVGGMAVQLALRAGAAVVYATGRDAGRLAGLPGGAEPIVADRPAQALAEHGGVDLMIDTVGGPDLPGRVTDGAVRPGGRAAIVGYTAGPDLRVDVARWMAGGVALLPVNLMRFEQRLRPVAAELLAEIAAGRLTFRHTVLPLADIGEALARLRAGTANGRLAVAPPGTDPTDQ